MKTYFIHEDRIAPLDKKLKAVERKCNKLGCSFTYNTLGEEIIEKEIDKKKIPMKFIKIEVEGIAKLNDWEFVGEVEHTPFGNIIRNATRYEVPERYRTTDVICEHCNTKRQRKSTFLVRNSVTGEFKQVGKSCLQVFTNGLNAEWMASYLNLFVELGEEDASGWSTSGLGRRYLKLDTVLRYALNVVKKFGYSKTTDEDGEYNQNSTKNLVSDLYSHHELGLRGFAKAAEKMDESELLKDEDIETVAAIRKFFSETEETSEYMFTLSIISKMDYIEFKHLGYVVSMIPTYQKHLRQEVERKLKEESNKELVFLGEVGDKISVDVKSWRCLTSYSTQFGWSYLYEFLDENANIVIWSTSKWLDENTEISNISGTVKKLETYRGAKQTHLTRCKIG